MQSTLTDKSCSWSQRILKLWLLMLLRCYSWYLRASYVMSVNSYSCIVHGKRPSSYLLQDLLPRLCQWQLYLLLQLALSGKWLFLCPHSLGAAKGLFAPLWHSGLLFVDTPAASTEERCTTKSFFWTFTYDVLRCGVIGDACDLLV